MREVRQSTVPRIIAADDAVIAIATARIGGVELEWEMSAAPIGCRRIGIARFKWISRR